MQQGRVGRDLQGGAVNHEREFGRRVTTAGALRRGGLAPAAGRGAACVGFGAPSVGVTGAVRASCVVTPAVSPAESHIRPAGLSKTGVPSLLRATKPPSAVGATSKPAPETVI
uniref:Uncharacterized protein n=1 Tax=Streptomyces avermitilis TaxID=33903 RepID=A0A499VP50_STRAX|nr:hypothetical protein SAVMC3_89420 [Streptomyces avermitilis]